MVHLPCAGRSLIASGIRADAVSFSDAVASARTAGGGDTGRRCAWKWAEGSWGPHTAAEVNNPRITITTGTMARANLPRTSSATKAAAGECAESLSCARSCCSVNGLKRGLLDGSWLTGPSTTGRRSDSRRRASPSSSTGSSSGCLRGAPCTGSKRETSSHSRPSSARGEVAALEDAQPDTFEHLELRVGTKGHTLAREIELVPLYLDAVHCLPINPVVYRHGGRTAPAASFPRFAAVRAEVL